MNLSFTGFVNNFNLKNQATSQTKTRGKQIKNKIIYDR